MKLNESRLISQITKLASQIKKSDDKAYINSCADGIISICSIIDTDNSMPYQFLPADSEAKIQHLSSNENHIDSNIFNSAREEQQNVTE